MSPMKPSPGRSWSSSSRADPSKATSERETPSHESLGHLTPLLVDAQREEINMSMRKKSGGIVGILVATTLVLGGAIMASAADRPAPPELAAEAAVQSTATEVSQTNRTIEVAEDGTRFVFAEAPRLANDLPAYGNAFVTQGYIYPAGTLTDNNGVLVDGSPQFPDRVIGEWTCWGYFVGEGADTTEGPWVVTTQVFEFFGAIPGEDTIVTVGFETPAGAGPAIRAVTGGSGDYGLARGDVTQVTLGHNLSDGVNAVFEFDLRGVRQHLPPAEPAVRVPH